MRTGLSFSMATSIMVRKLLSSFLPMETLPGLMRYLASVRAHVGILLQQDMPVVVEVADDRHRDAEAVEAVHDVGHGFGGGIVVDGDAHQFGTGTGQGACTGGWCRQYRRYRCWSSTAPQLVHRCRREPRLQSCISFSALNLSHTGLRKVYHGCDFGGIASATP